VHGGVSTVGAGSTIWFDPSRPAPARVTVAAESDQGSDPIMAHRGYPVARRVLYVEDVPDNLRLVQEILARRPQIDLISTALGRVALDLARAHRPDLILLDLNLPDIHGRDLLGQLSADPRTNDIPVVILSADATPGQIKRLHAAGATGYLTKPLQLRPFLDTLDALPGHDYDAPQPVATPREMDLRDASTSGQRPSGP
jgi:CheY-like chemotaxis protein